MRVLSREAWTRIWVIIWIFPVGNLLGIVLFTLICAPMLLTTAVVVPGGRLSAGSRVLALLFPAAIISASIVDCLWRVRQPPMNPFKRWLSVYEGATIIAFPVWLWAVVVTVALLRSVASESHPTRLDHGPMKTSAGQHAQGTP